MIHLTNDAIQKKSEEYGKFEGGNKVSYKEFEKYLNQHYPNVDFDKEIVQQMKLIATLAFKSVYGSIDPQKKDNSFEILGLDYMIDENFQVYLIEVNTNPCLELSSTLLCRLIPNMIENVMR
jgi:tubulin polyglutamylase TTLL1